MQLRTQNDDLNDIVSADTVIDCSTLPDLARHEQRDAGDINKLLARFRDPITGEYIGVPSRQTFFGELDETVDLEQAIAAKADLQQTWDNLPPHIKQKYSNWRDVLQALESGDIKLTPEEPNEPPNPSAPN